MSLQAVHVEEVEAICVQDGGHGEAPGGGWVIQQSTCYPTTIMDVSMCLGFRV